MVVERLARRHVLHVYLLPVRSVARDDIRHVLAVVRERGALQCHRAVGAQRVRVEPHAPLAEGRIVAVHLVEHRLVLQSVVAVGVPLAAALECHAALLVVHGLLQALQYRLAHRYIVEILAADEVFLSHPLCRGCARVVLQPTVRVCHLLSEVLVNGVVLRRCRIFQLCHSVGCRQQGCCCKRQNYCFIHFFFVFIYSCQ